MLAAVAQPPSGTVTFLFTDIEGSTRLWEEQPEAMCDLVAAHDARFRAAIEANGGFVVKATGDGFHAAFARAEDAVRAAQQLQAAVADLSPVTVRMGINTGEVQERDGDYFGPAVNRAARLMAAGHGGQVLLAGVTAELVPGLTLRNLGEHRLRDLASPMVVWQLGTGEFPPLRTLDDLPGNLPPQRTSFIGRVDEVRHLAELIETDRLVTLIGPGGVGKSRLALQAAAELAPRFRDGAWFASLAALAESALVATTVLESVSVRERQGEAALDTLCAWASAREALVVIDNCEHLLGEVARVVDRILDASATVRVIVTSQESLGVLGEHVWAVAPLSGAGGRSADSIELFVDRARMARADFTLTADNEAAVVEICERLDRVPLAIELAAARVRGMAPADIARRLDQRLNLLTSADRFAPDRHRTLEAATRWSYELLDQTQQRVFDRLSVFAGPFAIDAAGTIVAGDGVEAWEILDVVLALVDKSLVVADETSGGARYRLLETMREFGHGNLVSSGTEEVYRNRHADYYADFVLSRQPQLHGAGDQEALDEVVRELENIRVALRQAADDARSSRFDELYSALYLLWIGRGRLSEGTTWARELRDRLAADPVARIVALGFAANVTSGSALGLGNELASAAIELAGATGLGPPLMAHAVIGLVAMMQGDIPAAIDACEQVLASVDAEPAVFVAAESLIIVTAVLTVCGALDRLDPILPVLSDLVDSSASAYQRAAYGNTMAPVIHLTDPVHAGEYLARGYQRNRDVGNYHALGTTTMFLALHELRSGHIVPAAEWASRSIELANEHSPAFLAQAVDAAVAIVKRTSPSGAAVLLGALHAHRDRVRQAGSPPEIDAEARYEASLRRVLRDEFDVRRAEGFALDEPEMIAAALAQLRSIVDGHRQTDVVRETRAGTAPIWPR
jgi:predicted ATPase/class 3 adenylate cyclase